MGAEDSITWLIGVLVLVIVVLLFVMPTVVNLLTPPAGALPATESFSGTNGTPYLTNHSILTIQGFFLYQNETIVNATGLLDANGTHGYSPLQTPLDPGGSGFGDASLSFITVSQ